MSKDLKEIIKSNNANRPNLKRHY